MLKQVMLWYQKSSCQVKRFRGDCVDAKLEHGVAVESGISSVCFLKLIW